MKQAHSIYDFYQVDKQIGNGSFGEVFIGKNKLTRQPVAIKKINCFSEENGSQERFRLVQKEISVMSPLKNPQTLKMIDAIQVLDDIKGTHKVYIITQLCDYDLGKKLIKDKVEQQKRQPYAIELLTQIANGLYCLSRQQNKIIHRDLKPQNILVKNGLLKISDFGCSKNILRFSEICRTNKYIGTIVYTSPQILKGLEYTSKSDIWSIGVIFYQMLFEKRPWYAEQKPQMLIQIEKKPIEAKLNSNLNPIVREFLIKCLQLQQKNRMGRQQLFNHAIFEGFFDQTGKPNLYRKKLDQYINDAKQFIQANHINLGKLLSNHFKGENKDGIQFQSYYKFLQQINPKITLLLGLYIFNRTDTDISDTIEKHEIVQFFSKHGIEINQEPKVPEECLKFLQSLSELIKEHSQKYSLQKAFKIWDNDQNGKMDLKQFIRFFQVLDRSHDVNQIERIFEFIDQDNSKSIEFKQFLDLFEDFEKMMKTENK